ncbi:tetratricopeptide repeat protein [Candidatus Oscillochloris fontis]|uniref:tetratricopeptide repeat protein n=1 Tax=Candidatus Oscillochloris fontis TaxID=2496868 RepID=UPI001375C74F|nr:glycosyl transferase [Candidatus Oscillochloris fontis]
MRKHLPLLLILLLALVWRLLLWAQPLHLPANDEQEYIQVARDLLAGRGWVYYESWRWLRAPLYPLFLAGSLWLSGGDLHLAALPNIALSLGVVVVVYALTRALTERPGPPLLAASIAALLQTYATFASLSMSETLFSLLFGLGLLATHHWQRQRSPLLALLAGLLFGLACLTRSAGLVVLPLVAVWMVGVGMALTPLAPLSRSLREQERGGYDPRYLSHVPPSPVGEAHGRGAGGEGRSASIKGFLPLILLALGAGAVIAPWTLRNCQAYGHCILIETGGSYNMWAFYEPHESIEAINQALEAVANPAERADLANARGMARLQEDPSIILRKIPAEWRRIWAVNPIEDRFLMADYYSDPPPALFISALLLDDLLYLLILVAAPLGLLVVRRQPLAWLFVLWIATFCAATLVTHAEGRYRHFLFLVLIPLAACVYRPSPPNPLSHCVGEGGSNAPGCRIPPLPHAGEGLGVRAVTILLLSALLLALIPALRYYPWDWASSGVVRSLYRAYGDHLLGRAAYEAAEDAYRHALAASPTPDGWIALGDLQRHVGDNEAALDSYRRAHALRPPYVGASVAWGSLLRDMGQDEAARTAYLGRYLDLQHLVDWSDRMRPSPPTTQIDLGNGLDYGWVGGVYPAETQGDTSLRWTRGRAWLRLSNPAVGPVILRLRLAAPRPDGQPVPIQICAAAACYSVSIGGAWQTIQILLPAAPRSPVELRSPTFSAPDGRELGVMVDWAGW